MLKRALTTTLASAILAAVIIPSFALASSPPPTLSQCGSGTGATAIVQLNAGQQFTVYVRVPQAATSHAFTLTQQDFTSGGCIAQKPLAIIDTRWHRLAGLVTGSDNVVASLTLDAPGFEAAFASDKPQLLLLPAINAPCTPDAECTLSYLGHDATLNPKVVSLPSDTLEVLQAMPVSGDAVKQVNYLVDSQFAYQSADLASFDTRYVPAGRHVLTRQVVFASGQSLSISQSDAGDANWWGSMRRVASYYYLRYRPELILGTIVLSVFFLIMLIRLFAIALEAFELRHKHSAVAYTRRGDRSSATTSAAQQVAASDAGYRHFLVIHWLSLGIKWLVGLAVAAALAVAVWNYGIAFFAVSGLSMFPTLHDHDGMVISRLGRTWADMGSRPFVPHRFAIIVFKRESSIAGSGEVEYIVKRVYGLPGERVVVRGGKVTVYNTEHPKGYNPDDGQYWRYPVDTIGSIDTVVQPGEVFVMGDNRPESIDSRVFGAVPSTTIVGEVVGRLTPIKDAKLFLGE